MIICYGCVNSLVKVIKPKNILTTTRPYDDVVCRTIKEVLGATIRIAKPAISFSVGSQ
ncbi:hypothetical protein D3C86_1871970 [compost metagenome]